MFFYNMDLIRAMQKGHEDLQEERRQEAKKYFKTVGEEWVVDWGSFVKLGQQDEDLCSEILNQACNKKEILCWPQKGSIFLYDEDGSIKTPIDPITGTIYHFSPKREDEIIKYKEAKYPNQVLGLATLVKPVI